MKINEALPKGVELLRSSKSDIVLPLLEAQLLLAHILGKSKESLIAYDQDELDSKQEKDYFNAVNKRFYGCPIAYITGKKEFMELTLFVDRSVLIPRDDTEILVECVLDYAAKKEGKAEILNIGTGSGCIEAALASRNKNIFITGVDKYEKALKIASKNIKHHKLQNQITLLQSDLFSAIHPSHRFDIICSNPPYVSQEEMKHLSIDVAAYEPIAALYGGSDGLDFYRNIAQKSKNFLKAMGSLIVEIGCNQAEDVKQIFNQNGFINLYCMQDLSGRNRVICGDKK